jgi:hypothetical protein
VQHNPTETVPTSLHYTEQAAIERTTLALHTGHQHLQAHPTLRNPCLCCPTRSACFQPVSAPQSAVLAADFKLRLASASVPGCASTSCSSCTTHTDAYLPELAAGLTTSRLMNEHGEASERQQRCCQRHRSWRSSRRWQNSRVLVSAAEMQLTWLHSVTCMPVL